MAIVDYRLAQFAWNSVLKCYGIVIL